MTTRAPASDVAWPTALGVAWLGVAAWIWATRPGVLLAGHPSYAVLVTWAGSVGLALLVLAQWRRLRGVPARPRWRVLLVRTLAVALSLVVLGTLVWLRPFAATSTAVSAMVGTPEVRLASTTSAITLTPSGDPPATGLVFQPGARVDPRAYVPLLTRVSAEGYLVVIVKQPLGIGFTALGAPGGIIEEHPDVAHWAVGGHSLGGVVASSYAADHPGEATGLLLWASYPLSSLADRTDLLVASVSGSRDGLARPIDVEDSMVDLPPDTTYVAVGGAVHADFGDYGPQRGDGTPTIGHADAQQQIAAASIALLASLASLGTVAR